MITETEEKVTRLVTLPVSVPNTSANVEIWYQAYVPKGHLLVEIEPVEVTKEVPTVKTNRYVGIGNSLDYVGEDEPTKEESEEDDYLDIGEDEPYVGEEPRNKNGTLKSAYEDDESEEDDNGESFVSFEPVTSPKDEPVEEPRNKDGTLKSAYEDNKSEEDENGRTFGDNSDNSEE
jgi:hypothetical protein